MNRNTARIIKAATARAAAATARAIAQLEADIAAMPEFKVTYSDDSRVARVLEPVRAKAAGMLAHLKAHR